MPDLIYRFLPASSAIKSLLDRTLRASEIAKLNDPYDSVPGILNAPKPSTDEEEAERPYRSVDEFIRSFTNDRFKLISFSKKATDPVLWAHYADNHRGICLAFDPSAYPENSFADVQYSGDRACFCYSMFGDKERLQEMSDTINTALTTKWKSWAYEEEVRLIFSSPDERKIPEFFSMPDGFLKQVILGWNCEYTPANIRSVLKSVGLDHVDIKMAMLQDDRFEVRLMDYMRVDMDDLMHLQPQEIAEQIAEDIRKRLAKKEDAEQAVPPNGP
jgi:hypothetical protein